MITTNIKKPDFLCIGAQKCATSWLYNVLKSHSEIYLPPIKEIHYFDRSSKYPSPNLSNRIVSKWWWRHFKFLFKTTGYIYKLWLLKYLFGNYNDNWYKSLFADSNVFKKCGEITPAYSILDIGDIKKVYYVNDELRIIFFMRNPIDRSWSHLLMHLKNQNKILNNFSEKEMISFFKSQNCLLRSDYVRTVNNWRSVFPDNQFFVGFYEDVVHNPYKLINEISKHIGISDHFAINEALLNSKINEGPKIMIPDNVYNFLYDQYYHKIVELYDIFPAPVIKSWMIHKNL